MSRCLFHVRKCWKFLPNSKIWITDFLWSRTSWQYENSRNTVAYKNKTTLLHKSVKMGKMWHKAQVLTLYVVLTFTYLSLEQSMLVKGKNALSCLVASSDTKPCNLNTSVSRDNNTGSCVWGFYRCTQASSHILDMESYASVQGTKQQSLFWRFLLQLFCVGHETSSRFISDDVVRPIFI